MTAVPVVAIDGPGGSGKGTVSVVVAERLGWHFLDSGALYRLVGLAGRRQSIPLDDEDRLAAMTRALDVTFDFRQQGEASVMLDGEGVGEAIRTADSAMAASQVASLPGVRAALLDLQRGFRRAPGLVADGRDMGTVVFPDAPCKIYLTASAEERAKRRYDQLKAKGIDVNLRALLGEIRERDDRDSSRTVAPMKPADDAEVIDTTDLSIEQVIQRVMRYVSKRLS